MLSNSRMSSRSVIEACLTIHVARQLGALKAFAARKSQLVKIGEASSSTAIHQTPKSLSVLSYKFTQFRSRKNHHNCLLPHSLASALLVVPKCNALTSHNKVLPHLPTLGKKHLKHPTYQVSRRSHTANAKASGLNRSDQKDRE